MKRLLIVVIAGVCVSPLLAATPTELFFSEYVEGSSNNKALEIYNGTGAAVTLTGNYSVQIFFNGSSSPGLTISLTGTIASGDVFVLAQSSASAEILNVADQTNGSGWFNGDDAVVLRKGTTIIDVIGQIGFRPSTEWGTGLVSTADNTLRRKSSVDHGDTNGSDAFDPSVEWDGFANNTFDGLGSFLTSPPPASQSAEIWQIQGNGLNSPLLGVKVETTGVVTARTTDGFFIQTPLGDGDPNTSDGVFVFTGVTPGVQVGDGVKVTGTVVEFFDMTEIGQAIVTVNSSGNPLPQPVTLNETNPSHLPSVLGLEPFEGMLVRVEHGTAASGNNEFNEISVVAGPARPFREPGIEYPGLPGLPVFDGNPEIFEIDTDGTGLPTVLIPGGAAIDLAVGPLAYSFGDYQIWPTTLTYNGGAPATRAVRARASGEFTIGAQNMLRLYDAIDDPLVNDSVETVQRYADRLNKLSLQVRTILGSPDVLAVEEVENLGVLQDLADKIRFDDPNVQYTAHLMEGNDIGGIDVGFLVRDTVRVNSIAQIGKTTVFAMDGTLLNDRPPLLIDADYIGNGAPFHFKAIAVHQRSLSGIDGSSGDRVRHKRFEQSLELANTLQKLQTADPSARIVALGDFNAFEFTDGYVDTMGMSKGSLDPMGALLPGVDVVNPDFTDLVLNVPPNDRYSFVFDGTAQVLDHALTSTTWDKYARAVQFARGNADAPIVFSSDRSTPLRSADHDGIVLFAMSDFDADGYPDDTDSCAHGDARPTVRLGGCDSAVPNTVFTGGCSITDKLLAIKTASKNHGQYVAGAARYTQDLMSQGLITGAQKGAIDSCAAGDN